MKRIFSFLIAFLMAFAINANATKVTATFGDKNASNVYRITALADLSSSSNLGWVVFAQDTGIYYPYSSATTNTTLLASQTGTTMIFTGASDNTRFTLPTATVGMVFQITASVAKGMQLTPQSTDTIKYASLTAGQGLVNTTPAVGDGIEVICYLANTWAVKNITGTWTHNGASP